MNAQVVLSLCVIALLAGCATQARQPGAGGEMAVHVVAHGWHTGLAMQAADIDFARWPALPHPARARYIEVGWGDRDYYPAPGFNLWYGFKALFWPTASVLHVTGFDEPPRRTFPSSEVLELHVSRTGFERLLAYITSSFAPDAAPIAPSLYASGAFYPSRDKFHLFNTCNVWVARGLREAGIDVRPSLTMEGLMAQLRPLDRSPAGATPAGAAGLEARVHAALAGRGLGPDALLIIDNLLRHDGSAPRAAPPLARELLARPLAAAGAEAIFERSVPVELAAFAEGGAAGEETSFDRLLDGYIAALAEAQRALRAATARAGFDHAAIDPGRLSAEQLAGMADAVDMPALEQATAQFLAATARFVRGLRSPGLALPAAPRRIDSPIGLVSIGGNGSDRHGAEAALIIDPGGDDIYERAPAAPGTISVIVDLAGNDRYGGSDVAVRAFSALIDLGGDDRYAMAHAGLGAALAGASLLLDARGDDRYETGSFGLGAAGLGLGAVLDHGGNDSYRAMAHAQGYGVAGGLGLLWDRAGNDTYVSTGEPDFWQREGGLSFSQGAAAGLRSAIAGGVGILRDDAGDDRYEAQMFAQGAGYYHGIGLLWDRAGNDRYRAMRYAQGSGVHEAVGVLRDEDGDDGYMLGAGVGQGVGHDMALGLLLDAAGDDGYEAQYLAQGSASANGLGLLADLGGAGRWQMTGADQSAWGSAEPLRGLPSIGLLVYDPTEASFLRSGKAVPQPASDAVIEARPAKEAACPKASPARSQRAAPLAPALRLLARDLPAGTPDGVLYGDVLQRLMDDPRAAMEEVAPDDFDALWALGMVLPCAFAEASAEAAARMWATFERMLGADPRTPFAGVIGASLRKRPAPPATQERVLAALRAHPSCGVRAAAVTAWPSAPHARKALDSSCWREQAAGLEALRRLGAPASAGAPALPSFLR